MARLICDVPQSLLDALAAQKARTGESVDHIVTTALADAFQVEHATLFQISTTAALVEGVTRGAITVSQLSRHGDFGLGTFAEFDGEMVMLEGTVYQVTRCGVTVPGGDAQVPFAVVTHFLPESSAALGDITSFDDLVRDVDALRNTGNDFFAVRIDGRFDYVKTRAVGKSDGSASLVAAASAQAEFEFEGVEGVLVGFWAPIYAKALNVPGWHLHFLTADRSGGGHLLTCRARGLRAQVQHFSDFHLALPETAEFLRADLTRDTSRELDKAEKDH